MKRSGDEIIVDKLCKFYGGNAVIRDFSLTLKPGRAYCLMAPSGAGKTTLFRILLGLEPPDSGTIHGLSHHQTSAVFQEDRLLEGYTALQNLRLVTGHQYTNTELTKILLNLLPEDALKKPVCEFSGGMKRRTAILRALLAPFSFLIMDEPFTGLDYETRFKAIDLIKEYTRGKILLVSTHQEEDVSLLKASLIRLYAADHSSIFPSGAARP